MTDINVDGLTTLLNSMISALGTEIAYEAINGAKPSYSLKDQSVDWNTYRSSMLKQIDDLCQLISKFNTFDLTQEMKIKDAFMGRVGMV